MPKGVRRQRCSVVPARFTFESIIQGARRDRGIRLVLCARTGDTQWCGGEFYRSRWQDALLLQCFRIVNCVLESFHVAGQVEYPEAISFNKSFDLLTVILICDPWLFRSRAHSVAASMRDITMRRNILSLCRNADISARPFKILLTTLGSCCCQMQPPAARK